MLDQIHCDVWTCVSVEQIRHEENLTEHSSQHGQYHTLAFISIQDKNVIATLTISNWCSSQ